MLSKLLPTLTAAEKKTITTAAAEYARLWNLAARYQRITMMNEREHPLHVEIHEAIQATGTNPTKESLDGVLAAIARKSALTDRISGDIGNAIFAAIDKVRETLRPITDRLVAGAREKFDIEADQRRAALPTGEAGGVIGGDPAAELESAIATAKAALEDEILAFQADPLVSLPALCES